MPNSTQGEGKQVFSRRSVFAKIGSVVAGIAGFVAATSLNAPKAQAARDECCTGPAFCDSGCPPGTSVKWSWVCVNPGSRVTWQCNDCYTDSHRLVCVDVEYNGT
jgi:hypothetical protein